MPPLETLNALFEVKDGVLINKVSRSRATAGHVSGCEKDGYVWVKVNNQRFSAHRIIFLMAHGYCPEYIDHIDGNSLNNLIENLRPATLSENKANQKIYSSNSSGVKGVYWCKPKNAWVAQISFNRVRKTLGHFSTKELAASCVAAARNQMHGEYARHV